MMRAHALDALVRLQLRRVGLGVERGLAQVLRGAEPPFSCIMRTTVSQSWPTALRIIRHAAIA
jgi:hypothetical protein